MVQVLLHQVRVVVGLRVVTLQAGVSLLDSALWETKMSKGRNTKIQVAN